MTTRKYCILVTGTRDRRYTVCAVTWSGTNPIARPTRTLEESMAIAESLGISVSAIGDLYHVIACAKVDD